ncbi:complement factor H-related protein 1-like isoform X2 [Sebastes fasciatus]|uniref:complement factor H-related protein 1-like isoform X2 n=1 Tax=Sebastes fasciatus TaxID=394691 RepID=UPI003D9DC261
MYVGRYLGFVLLVWFPGALHAQSANVPCRAPRLNGGYLVPEQDTYPHETNLAYACDNGRKPAVEGWWATTTCLNGTWSHEPQCIDEKACMPPTIPNGIYTVNTNGWYEERDKIWITCNEGYKHKNRDATAECVNGTWTSVPICEKSIHACGEPPQIPHAIIIDQEYQEVFPGDTEVQYECEDGYTVEGADTKKSIYCIAGNWTEGPKCSSRPGTGDGGSAGGGHTTSTGSGTQPVGGGSSSSSGLNEMETEHQITTIRNCGNQPVVPNGDVVGNNLRFLRYQCANFYKRVGPEDVVCYSDGTWSEVPTCRAAFCSVNTDGYPQLIPGGVKYIKDGETVRLQCVELDHWWTQHYSVVRCTFGTLSLSRCCGWFDLKRNIC